MKKQTLSPAAKAAFVAVEDAAALDRDLRTTASSEFEIRSTRREIDEDMLVEFEAEDLTSYGPGAPRVYRNEVVVPVRKSRRCGYSARSDFEAMAGFNLIHGIESAQHGICVRPEPTVIKILKYDMELDSSVHVREVVIEDDEDEEAIEREAQQQVIDGKVMYHGAGVTVFRGGKFTFDDVATGVLSRGGKWNNVDGPKPKTKKPAQPANQPKKKYEYVCTEAGCGKKFTCKSQLSTAPGAAPIRCEACRKAHPIHSHVPKSAAQ